MRRASLSVALLVLLLISAFLSSQSPNQDDAFTTAMKAGSAALSSRHPDDAIKEFKKATKLRNEANAWLALSQAYADKHEYNDAEDAAKKALKLATDNQNKGRGHCLLGYAISCQASASDHKKLENAEEEFRAGLECDPNSKYNQFRLGEVLLRQSRDQEGITMLKQYLEQGAESPSYEKAALTFIRDPRRARLTFAPEFSATTIDGKSLGAAELKGKIVLIDFWATWCPACVASVNDVRRFARNYPADRVVVLSVSADKDEDRWRTFVAKNKMDWPQVFDSFGIARAFNVHVFPSYYIIDDQGIILDQVIGSGIGQGVAISEDIKKAIKAQDKREAQSKAVSNSEPKPAVN